MRFNDPSEIGKGKKYRGGIIVRVNADRWQRGKRGICGEETLARLLDILHRYGLPTETGYPLDKLYEAELVDKKISGGKMHLIVPEKIGQVRMETIPVEALRDWMQDGGIR